MAVSRKAMTEGIRTKHFDNPSVKNQRFLPAVHCGMTATGSHGNFDSLRGAPPFTQGSRWGAHRRRGYYDIVNKIGKNPGKFPFPFKFRPDCIVLGFMILLFQTFFLKKAPRNCQLRRCKPEAVSFSPVFGYKGGTNT